MIGVFEHFIRLLKDSFIYGLSNIGNAFAGLLLLPASAVEIKKEASSLAKRLEVDSKIKIHTVKTLDIVSRADIVTNLGFVRPIDKRFISYMKSTAVVPLMFETW